MKIHYRNMHGTTNLPWQKAFKKLGDLSLGPVTTGGFPDEIDHLHLGGSCKGKFSVQHPPITVDEIKAVQTKTGCKISVFYGDAWPERFQFHHELLDSGIQDLKIYSTALYGTKMWRPEVTWVAQPTDEDVYKLVDHQPNSNVMFVGNVNPYRQKILDKLEEAGIAVDVVKGKYGSELAEYSKNYSISIGMFYREDLPRVKYSSARLPNMLAMGMVHIEAGFDLSDVFNDDELIQWDDVDDLIYKIQYYQEYLDEGREICLKGRQNVLDNWTFTKLAERFITSFDEKQEETRPAKRRRGRSKKQTKTIFDMETENEDSKDFEEQDD